MLYSFCPTRLGYETILWFHFVVRTRPVMQNGDHFMEVAVNLSKEMLLIQLVMQTP
jgi:hypothetical protein